LRQFSEETEQSFKVTQRDIVRVVDADLNSQ
jgi:hypothetical protein